MKKKILCVVLALVLVLTFAACGGKKGDDNKNDNDAGKAPVVEIKDSADLLNKVYAKFTEDQQFAVMGGSAEEPVMDGAGLYPISDKEGMQSMFHIAEKDIDLVSEVASMMHAMNGNTFTATVYKLKDAKTAADFTASLKESIKSTQWMCGFPDSLLIYTVNDSYVVAVFGADDILTPFKDNMTAVYGDSAVLSVEESLVQE